MCEWGLTGSLLPMKFIANTDAEVAPNARPLVAARPRKPSDHEGGLECLFANRFTAITPSHPQGGIQCCSTADPQSPVRRCRGAHHLLRGGGTPRRTACTT